MYITITAIIGEKTIDLAYPIQGKEVAVVSVFSGNIQYEFMESRTLELGESISKRIIAVAYIR